MVKKWANHQNKTKTGLVSRQYTEDTDDTNYKDDTYDTCNTYDTDDPDDTEDTDDTDDTKSKKIQKVNKVKKEQKIHKILLKKFCDTFGILLVYIWDTLRKLLGYFLVTFKTFRTLWHTF